MFTEWLPDFIDAAFIRNVVISVVFLLVMVLIRSLARRAVLKRESLEPEMRRRWVSSIGNVTGGLSMIGLAFIWASQIETLAVSLVAIAAAIVLATREMILCLMGTIYLTSTHAYTVGDRIEINGLRGQVIDGDMLSTTLMEAAQAVPNKSTVGRVITFPNSLLLTHPVSNETMFGQYVVHNVSIRISREDDWLRAEQVLLHAATGEVARYGKDIAKHARDLQRSYGLEAPALIPRVKLLLDDRESIGLLLQLPVPLEQRGQIEQRILHAFLTGTTERAAVTAAGAPGDDAAVTPVT